MALRDDIFTRCRAAGIPLSGEAAEKLFQFHLLLTDWNKRMDLTAVLEESEMVDRHYIDSLSPLKTDSLFLKGASVIDVGSGAGFPGIPLAIARPDLHVTLLDAQQKRVRFLQEASMRLDLGNVRAVHGRAEDTAHLTEFRESFSLALARAVASLPALMELLLPFVRIGGRALCWKGPAVLDELPSGDIAAKLLGGTLEEPIMTPIPGRDWAHLLIPCLKTGKTLRQYPRKAGTPGRSPLGNS
jgi:16S rRNA (guanine527-N7)-methyltransferase